MTASRLALALCLALFLLAGCGGGDKTVTEITTGTQTQTGGTTQATTTATTTTTGGTVSQGNHGPHYFETPSHNIGCFLAADGVRCDIRERTWSPPPEPASCKKFGVDYGQGIALSSRRADFVCAGDTTLGGPGRLGYGSSAQRGPFTCESEQRGVTCRDVDTGHGFFLSRERYRIF